MAHNPTILITRPEPQASRFAARLSQKVRLAQIKIVPLTTCRFLPGSIDGPANPNVAFTSENGVRAANNQWVGVKGNAFAVGDRTADVATDFGWQTISARGTSLDLAQLLADQSISGPILWPRGQNAGPDFSIAAKKLGLSLLPKVVYCIEPTENGSVAKEMVANSEITVLPVFSHNGALAALKSLASLGASMHVVAISDAAAVPFLDVCPVTVANEPNANSMIDAIASMFPDDSD